MKTQIKRLSKSTLAVVLTLCMLFSCATVGIIATDAAKVDSETVGSNGDIQIYGNLSGNSWSLADMTDGGDGKYYYILDGSKDYYFRFKDTSQSKEAGPYSDNYVMDNQTSGYGCREEYSNAFKLNSGKKYKVWFYKDNWNAWVEPINYYLHYAEDDSGMSSATVQQMTDNGDGTYSYTVSGWNKTKMNMIVNTSSTNVTNSYDSTSLTVTTDTGLSVDESSPKEYSSYYRMQLSLSTTPQNITFTFDSSTGVLNAAGSLTRYAITAGGSSTGAVGGYKLKISDGSTTINNYGGSSTANFLQNKTLTVTVTPDVNTQKVTAITGCSSVTDNGDGTYSGTFTVSSTSTITATLANKSNCTVTFTAGSNGSVSATANGAALASGSTVLEGTKVTFVATADDGYVFSAWSGGFTDTLSTVTKTISADTTVTANFAKQGYKIVYQGAYGSSGKSMTEMANGKFISSVTVGDGWYFKIYDTGRTTISKASGTPQSLSANKEYDVTGWETDPASWNSANSFSNATGATAYVVYDPANDTVYLTSESDGLFSSYEVYIKDGTVRYLDNSWAGFSADYGTTTLESTGTTSGVTASTVNNYNSQIKKITLTAAQVREGVDLYIKTTVNNDYQSSYYVKGFDVNGGLTQGIISQEFDDDGNAIGASSYTDTVAGGKIHTSHSNDFILTVDGDNFPDQKIEVTPIYFPIASKDTDFVRFYAYDFTEDVKKDWGGSLAVYPYIEGKYNPYGKYPGQLMVNEGGVYYADIPSTYTDGEDVIPIQGLTMNNYVWDALHYDLFYGSDQTGNNWQTYDYNEFAVINDILQNTTGLENEDIIFSFKYKATVSRADSNLGESTYYVDSDNPDATNAKDYRNGYQTIEVDDSMYQWEDLTDFYGNKVDIFGDLVEVTNNETKMAYNPIRIVSNGYDDNAVGYYATAWALYKPVDASGSDAWTGTVDHYELFDVIGGQGRADRTFQSESFLIALSSQNRVRMKYDETFHNAHWGEEYESQGYPQSTLIIDAALVPVQITYEYNVQSNHSNIGTGPDQLAYRSDGRWYYSDSNQLIKANAIVEVANSKAGPFVRDYFQENNYDYKSGENYNPALNTGLSTSVKAYLTNDDTVEKNSVTYQNVNGNTQAYAISDGNHEYKLY